MAEQHHRHLPRKVVLRIDRQTAIGTAKRLRPKLLRLMMQLVIRSRI